MGILKSLFKPKRSKNSVNESFVKSEIIYNSYSSFYLLISFSKDKLNDAVEFMSDVNKCSKMNYSCINAIYRHSSYEEETDAKDDKGYPIYNVYDRYYILLGGTDKGFYELIKRSDNLANDIIISILDDISNNRPSAEYKTLIDDNIFPHRFIYDTDKRGSIKFYDGPTYRMHIKDRDIFCEDLKYIKSQLPKCFSLQSILGVVMASDNSGEKTINKLLENYYFLITEKVYTIEDFSESFTTLLDVLFPVRSDEDLLSRLGVLVGPQYMIPEEESDDGISDADIDEIFKEKYERFVGLIDDTIEYEDIDEQLSKETIPLGDEE